MKQPSFSQNMKDELLALEFASEEEAGMWFCCALASAGVFRAHEISIKSAQKSLIGKLSDTAFSLLGIRGEVCEKKAHAEWTCRGREEVLAVRALLEDVLDFDTVRGSIGLSYEDVPEALRIEALRAFLLTAGSMADPMRSYQIEFSLRRQTVSDFLRDILNSLGIETLLHIQHPYQMLYIKSGDDIYRLLALVGAHASVLRFENERVRKEMNAQINRAVNCDSANTQRVADSAARQLALLRQIEEAGALSKLPDELAEAARLRLENPGASLRELGEYLNPPLGKSGMYHRLGRLEAWAKSYLQKENLN